MNLIRRFVLGSSRVASGGLSVAPRRAPGGRSLPRRAPGGGAPGSARRAAGRDPGGGSTATEASRLRASGGLQAAQSGGPRKAAAAELLAHCNGRKAKDSNPACSVELRRLPAPPSPSDVFPPPRVVMTYPNDAEEATLITEGDTAQGIRDHIVARGRLMDTELLFRDGGEKWPVIIPEEELDMPFPSIKEKAPCVSKVKKLQAEYNKKKIKAFDLQAKISDAAM